MIYGGRGEGRKTGREASKASTERSSSAHGDERRSE
jgi:hypothetical protein